MGEGDGLSDGFGLVSIQSRKYGQYYISLKADEKNDRVNSKNKFFFFTLLASLSFFPLVEAIDRKLAPSSEKQQLFLHHVFCCLVSFTHTVVSLSMQYVSAVLFFLLLFLQLTVGEVRTVYIKGKWLCARKQNKKSYNPSGQKASNNCVQPIKE